jgi:GPH family glycoside/pentoside/hexuronide:cation symporter
MAIPIFVYMSKFYADVVLVPLGYLALAIALARAFDAITDPLIGWLSDRTRTRVGRRRPYLALGAPLCGLAFFALFSPPVAFSGGATIVWFGACFLLYFVCHTIFVIPYNALGAELRGSLSADCLALLPARRLLAAGGVLRDRPGHARCLRLPALAGASGLRDPGLQSLRSRRAPRPAQSPLPDPALQLRRRKRHRRDPGDLASVLHLLRGTCHFVAGLISIPLWVAASKRYGKRAAWLTGFAVAILALGGAFFLGEGDVAQGIALLAVAGVAFGGQLLLTPSIQADVIDYDELQTGRRREAQYGALWALFPKLVAIPGAAIPLAILGAIGYQPNAEQAPQVVFAIRVLFALVPAAFSSIAFVIAWRFPITEKIHRQIRTGIGAHARGEAAPDPLSGARLFPPGARDVDEETGWLLDHFSPRELRTALSGGVTRLRRDTALAAIAALGICAACVTLAVYRVGDLSKQPGTIAVVAIAVAGLALSLFLFHAIRMWVARRLHGETLRPADLRAHLAALEALRETPTEGS